jgi:16S rRNA (guanine527-N7)-methyltransferase
MLPAGGASPPEVFRGLLEARASDFGLSLSPIVLEKLSRFLAELDQARRRTNLVGPVSKEQLVDHVLESVLGGPHVPRGSRLVDIGSGAGFPGVPLAIARPDVAVVAVEPRRLRCDFLRRVAERVPIPNVSVVCGKARDLGRESADVATVRAVGSLQSVLADAHFLRPGGLLLAWTADAAALESRLPSGAGFRLETDAPVPHTRTKRIAGFRKPAGDVPRGTPPRISG